MLNSIHMHVLSVALQGCNAAMRSIAPWLPTPCRMLLLAAVVTVLFDILTLMVKLQKDETGK